MEWDTGVTRARIMYETCWYRWKHSALDATSFRIFSGSTPAAWNAAGVNCTPSTAIAMGVSSTKEIMVIMEKRPMAPPSSSLMSGVMKRFERTFRKQRDRLDPIAAENPIHVKESSVKDAPMTPAGHGMRTCHVIRIARGCWARGYSSSPNAGRQYALTQPHA